MTSYWGYVLSFFGQFLAMIFLAMLPFLALRVLLGLLSPKTQHKPEETEKKM